jgi:hypothetical protein
MKRAPIINLFKRIQFLCSLVGRFFMLFFRRNKKLHRSYLKYSTQHHFRNSYVVIEFAIQNVWYIKINGKRSLERRRLVLDLSWTDIPIELIAYGLAGKAVYSLQIKPELELHASNFKTSINVTAPEKLVSELMLRKVSIETNFQRTKLQPRLLNIKTPKVTTSITPFIKSEFI